LQSTPDNVSEVVTAKAEYFQFFFKTLVGGVAVTSNNQDLDGNP